MDDDIVRFLVSTDNHLGYAERDPIRGNDSFAAFEEVLRTAIAKKVDFVLLAGDMFHENKPSRKTLHSTMELLRRYSMGSDPIFIEILNDQREIFRATLGQVNYEDPFQAIRLPVFAIHGNHDDPSREGGTGDALAALDLLAVSNLINYYGKADRVEDIEITPILIRKANTKIALYGLGAMRDERLNRMWNQKKVKFVRLTEAQGRDDFYNIFVLHQNRDYGRGKKNCVHESMIPEWMDLVIWGNEHECQPNLAESLVGTYRILQPGSSVACSLSSTESASCPKHMSFFEVKQRKFRMKPIRYQQVRQFHYDEVSLRSIAGLDPNLPKVEDKIKDELTRKIRQMIDDARAEIADPVFERLDEFDDGPKYSLIEPRKVLIRLKVDYEGFSAINHQRFGAQFAGDVANPTEVLLLTKKRKEIIRPNGEKVPHTAQGELQMLIAEGAEDEIHKIKIEDLVNETLAASKHSLTLLAETDLAKALDDYIIRKIPNAIQDLVVESLERAQRDLARNPAAANEALARIALPDGGVKAAQGRVVQEVDLLDSDDDKAPKRGRGAAAKATKGAAKKETSAAAKKTAASRRNDSDDEDADEKPKRASGRQSARSVAKKPVKYIESDDDEDEDVSAADDVEMDDDDDDIDDVESEDEPVKKGRGRGKAKPAAKPVAAKRR